MIARIVNFFGDKQYTKLRWRLLIAALILIIAADFLVDRHGTHFWETIPGWSAGYGFISCVAIIFISKFIGHKGGIMRDEDYYD